MAELPTKEDCARRVLKVYENFNCRPGYCLRIPNFHAVWFKGGGTSEDLNTGLNYALESEWIEKHDNGISYRLTEAGFKEI